jgi:ubiquinone/menaquinone biosynthesis C-methylase UbiE
MDPQKIVDSFGIDSGNIVADFGSGAGYFTLPLAKAATSKGKVFAVDILPSALEVVDKKARMENITNIELVQADLERENSTKIMDSSVDFVVVSNLLFQLENKANIFREAKRVLKSGGKLIVIDWAGGKIILGPPEDNRVTADQVQIAAVVSGFKEIKQWYPDSYHYGFIFMK